MTFCRKYVEWKKNPNWKTGSTDWKPISCYNCGKPGHTFYECKGERQNNGGRGIEIKEAERWQNWRNQWQTCKR